MKRVIFSLLMFVMPIVISSAQSRSERSMLYGAGARVGLGSMLQKAEQKSDRTMGFDGSAEGVFIYYFPQSHFKLPIFGIRTGLSLGYRQNSLMMDYIDISYKADDADGNSILYNIKAKDVKETDRLFSLEIPIMCAAYYEDLFLNLGLRMSMPLLSRYKQTMTDPSISATYEEYGVTISGERVTGQISTDDNKKKAKLDAASFNLCLSFEFGYTFDFLGNKLLAGAYADYGLVDNYKGKGSKFTDADPSAIDSSTNTPTTVIVNSLTDSYVNKVGICCVGIRAVYAWQFPRDNGRRAGRKW